MSPANLVVVGDVLLDREAVGSTQRLCPDAPCARHRRGAGRRRAEAVPGSLPCSVPVRTSRSRCPRRGRRGGERVRAGLDAAGVGLVAWGTRERPGRSARSDRQAGGQGRGRLDEVAGRHGGHCPGRLWTRSQEADAILVSCYGAGPAAWRRCDRPYSRPHHVPVIWDPHPRGASPIPAAPWRRPMRRRRAAMSGRSVARPPDLAAEAVQRWRSAAVSVTVGAEGSGSLGRATSRDSSATTATSRAVQGPLRIGHPTPPRWRGAAGRRPSAGRQGLGVGRGWRGQRPSGRLRCCPRRPYGPAGPVQALWKRPRLGGPR